jgi:predicted transcriptional regulator
MAMNNADTDYRALAAQIVSAHVSHNATPATELPALIQSVHAALAGLGNAASRKVPPAEPAVPIRKSVFPDYIICLEDGKKLKMLKRHLHTSYAMTPDQYRARWVLPRSYPMVAPNYAERRSVMAKSIGLGRGARKPASEPATGLVESVAMKHKVAKKVGRPRKGV